MRGQNEYIKGKEELRNELIRANIIDILTTCQFRELELIYQFVKNLLDLG